MAALPVERTLRPGSSMTTEMKVDLPVPLRPTRPTFSPAPTTKEASRSRVRSPISMVREEPTIMGEGAGRCDRGVPGTPPGTPRDAITAAARCRPERTRPIRRRSAAQPPDTRRSPPAGGVGSSTVSSHRRVGGPAGGRWCGPGPSAAPRRGRRDRVEPVEQPVATSASDRGQGQAPADGRTRPGTRSGTSRRACGTGADPRSSPKSRHSRSGWARIMAPISPRPGRGLGRAPGKASARSRKSHGPAEAAPADHHAVAPGGRHHGQGVGRLPQVAVAEDRDGGDRLLESGDGRPVGRARVELLGRAGVQGDGGHPFGLGDPAGLEVGEVGRRRSPCAS